MAARTRRLCLLGGRSVGKSTITIQFVENHFAAGYNPTIESTFHRSLRHRGREYNLEIVDTAGHDEYTLFNNSHAVGVHGYILVFATDNAQSFELVQIINDKLLTALGVDKFPRVLVGNKTDLLVGRAVSAEQGQALAQEWGCPYVETSGKHNDHVEEMFFSMLDEIDTEREEPEKRDEKVCVLV